ncbi:MAG TPA: GtrA family protein [Candidatus Saccharimonadales bacterium]
MADQIKKHVKKATKVVRKAAAYKKVRFAAVGVVNTAVDFGILNLLVLVFSIGLVPANIISTTLAMLTSFTLNKNIVFRQKGPGAVRQFVLFIIVTLVGIWLLQTVIVVQTYEALERLLHEQQQTGLLAWFILNAAKAFGVAAGIVWNYLWYSRFVFKTRT